jgi:hypothetical protein
VRRFVGVEADLRYALGRIFESSDRRTRRGARRPRGRQLVAVPSVSVVLVEGISDRLALEALAQRRGLDLAAAGVEIVPMGGAHAIGRYLHRFPDQRLAALCDAGERCVVLRAGFPEHALFVCDADLEDEVIRAAGGHVVEALLADRGDAASFRTFQRQLAWRGQPLEAQLGGFFTSSDRRKFRYLPLLVAAAERVPAPLAGVLDYALSPGVTTPAS